MPCHVIVYRHKRKNEYPWLLADQVFRQEDYPNSDNLLEAVSGAVSDLFSAYPPPDYTVRSGIGPDSSQPGFESFVAKQRAMMRAKGGL